MAYVYTNFRLFYSAIFVNMAVQCDIFSVFQIEHGKNPVSIKEVWSYMLVLSIVNQICVAQQKPAGLFQYYFYYYYLKNLNFSMKILVQKYFRQYGQNYIEGCCS